MREATMGEGPRATGEPAPAAVEIERLRQNIDTVDEVLVKM